jgi:glucose/arabinose dehydrogenase
VGGSLLFTTLKGSTLYRVRISDDGMTAMDVEALFPGEFGRLRDVLVGDHGEVYLATSNRDGVGSPAIDDDRIIVISR